MKDINWGQAIAILANVGVIAGIAFLVIEVRQNNDLLQSDASIAYIEMRTDGIAARGQSTEMLQTLVKAWDGEELTPVELLRLDFIYWSTFINWEWEYEQYRKGVLEVLDQPPAGRYQPIVSYYPYMRDSWEKHKATLSPEFVRYMESEVLN